MDVVQKLIRILQDDFKVGAEMRSGKPLIYIDPNKFDLWKLEKDASRIDLDAASSQLAKQFDDQYPGISKKFSAPELLALTKNSLELGPFADKREQFENPICVVNQPKGNEWKAEKIYETFQLNTRFNPAHLKPLPGLNSVWAQMIGEHEGEHCNQEMILNDDPDIGVKTLDGEIRSDRAAIETLRTEGHQDVVTAWKAIRAIAAANGDDTHATSIFFDDPEFNGATKEHLDAAKTFLNEMNMGVATNLGIPIWDAMSLRFDDPQKYANAAEDALKKGEIPALRDISETDAKKLVAQKMGISEDSITEKPAKEISAAYQALKAEGALQDRGPQNPHTNKYIQSYIDGTRFLFVKDTTPTKPESSTPVQSDPEISEQELAEQTAKELEKDADYEAGTVMDEIVKESLGLNDDQLLELVTQDPDKYYDLIEEGLKKGTVPLQTTKRFSQDEIDELISKKLEIPLEEVSKQPSFISETATQELENEGALTIKRDNPYLKEKIQNIIQQYRQDKIDEDSKPTLDNETPPTTPASGKYSYLMSTPQNDGKGIPQIDLRSEDKAQMKIGCLSACEYFATKADPVLAAQAVKPLQSAEINDPTLKQKVASNATSYLSTANSLA